MGFQQAAFYDICNNPLLLGYLQLYCKRHFCGENLDFLLAELEYRKLFTVFLHVDWVKENDDALNESAINVEKRYDLQIDPCVQVQIEKTVNAIWRDFLDPTSKQSEVCLPFSVIDTTKFRVSHYKRFGPEVFSLAVEEPTRTMIRDIIPRYMQSPEYVEMKLRREMCICLPGNNFEVVPKPSLNDTSDRLFGPIDDFFSNVENYALDYTMYTSFLAYLKEHWSQERILCYRAVMLYKRLIETGDFKAAKDTAWTIFCHFIARGSCFEISVSDTCYTNIAINMCDPGLNVFDCLLAVLNVELTSELGPFLETEKGQEMRRNVLSKRRTMERSSRRIAPMADSWSCLSVSGHAVVVPGQTSEYSTSSRVELSR